MMDLSIVRRTEISPQVWDAFVLESDDAWMWHLWDLQEANLKVPWRRDLGFAVRDNDRLVAVVPLQFIERPIVFPFKKRR